MTNFDIKGKVALVTGANRGIGAAFVKHLVQSGASKVIAGVRDLDNAKALTVEYPNCVEPMLLDVTNVKHITELAQKISSLDIIINNAGIASLCNSTSNNTIDVARLEMETHYFGPVQINQILLPLLKKSNQAAIINISSIAGISCFPSLGPYSATKSAMHSYTQGLRAELNGEKSGKQIQVIGVYPGPTDTRLAPGEMDKASTEQIAKASFDALSKNETDVFPDDFSKQMRAAFLEHPHELEKIFSQM